MKKKLSLLLATTIVAGAAGNAEAALWDLNFGKTKPASYTGSGLAPESTDDDYWVANTAYSASGYFDSTEATGEKSALYDFESSITGINPSSTYALSGYISQVSKMDFDFNSTDFAPTKFEVYLYTSNGNVTLNAGTNTSIVSSTKLTPATSFSDGTSTVYTVTRYYVWSTDPGLIKLATTSDATGRVNAVQVRSVVPEPSTIMLLGVGGLIASFGVKRRYATIES